MKEQDFLNNDHCGWLERDLYRRLSVKNQRLVRHMASEGLFYDPVNSYKGCLYFNQACGSYSPMQFTSWKDVREYVNGCVFE